MGKCTGALRGVTLVRNCDSHQGGVKGIRKVCQLMGRCDDHVGSVKKVLPDLLFCKLLPVNPTNYEDSRNYKETQRVVSTLDFLEIS